MKTENPDLLSLCVNGNCMAKILENSAEETRAAAADPHFLSRTPERWASYLNIQAQIKEDAASMIRTLVAEVNRLRAFER